MVWKLSMKNRDENGVTVFSETTIIEVWDVEDPEREMETARRIRDMLNGAA